MSESNLFRLITVNGIVIDFQSVNSLEAMWILLKGEGFFQMGEIGSATRRIPFHAIASLERVDPKGTAIYGPSPSESRN